MAVFWLANLIAAWLFLSFPLPAATSPATIVRPASEAPFLEAEKGAVLFGSGRAFVFSRQADAAQPIASISKLMTALVFLEHNPGWDEIYTIGPEDQISGGKQNLFLGEKMRLKDIFHASLVASDNGATLALVNASGLSQAEFVQAMNDKAKALGLRQTTFAEPTGLSDNNVSTAREVVLLARAAFQEEAIRQAVSRSAYEFATLEGREKYLESTDRLLGGQDGRFRLLAGKTGYTEAAGYCFVALAQDESGRQVISAVLGGASDRSRFADSARLIDWALGSQAGK